MHALKALDKVRLEDFEVEYVEENTFGSFGDGWTVAKRTGDVEGLTYCLNKVHARRFGGVEDGREWGEGEMGQKETDSIANEEVVRVPTASVLSV
jgi:hypothetical protein